MSDIKYIISLKRKTLDEMVVGDTVQSWRNDEPEKEITKISNVMESEERRFRVVELDHEMLAVITEPEEELIQTMTLQ